MRWPIYHVKTLDVQRERRVSGILSKDLSDLLEKRMSTGFADEAYVSSEREDDSTWVSVWISQNDRLASEYLVLIVRRRR